MKNLVLGASLSICLLTLHACQSTKNTQQTQNKITLKGEFNLNTSTDTVRLYRWSYVQMHEIQKAPLQKGDTHSHFALTLNNLPQGVYFIGTKPDATRPLLLGTEKAITIVNEKDDADWLVQGSQATQQLDHILQRINQLNGQFANQMRTYAQAEGQKDEESMATAAQTLRLIDQQKKQLLDSTQKINPFLQKIVALHQYQSFQNNHTENQPENTYFAENFLKTVNFEDTTYAHLPYYFEALQNYGANLLRVGLSDTQVEAYFDDVLAKVPQTAPHRLTSLASISLSLVNSKPKLFVKYAKAYTETHLGRYPKLDAFLQQRLLSAKGGLQVGDVAPDFAAKTPEGQSLNLKSLRGKVVLIDFWASWCGPCRRENPNVVKLYEKYKKQGFEILGVSLDTKKDRWTKAIKQDKLTWPQISELSGWNTQAARLYNVRAIPYTVLLDKEGKIIATRLRGASLEQKLHELFD